MCKERSSGFLIFRRFNSQIEYLLLKASQLELCWGAPKGHVENKEDDFTTALRETREEAGYVEDDLLIHKELYKKLSYKVGNNDKTVVYWLAELKDPEKKPKLSHEHTEYCWLTKDQAIQLVGFDDFAEMVNYFHEKICNL